jgi:hypothetical protein
MAQATMVLPASVDEMLLASDVVVVARVREQSVTWSKDHARILTITGIEVLQAVKGASRGDLLTIYQVGGTLDSMTYAIRGALHFEPGEEMVLFAKRFESMLVTYGLGQGKFVVRDIGGVKTALPEYGDVVFVQRLADGRLAPAAPPPSHPEPLGSFVERLGKLSAASRLK